MRKPRMLLLVVVLVSSLALSAQVAFADQVYHSQHISLSAVGGAPLRSGYVENIHVNGPTIFANEVYVLNGAMPSTTYHVALNIYMTSTTCAGAADLVIPAADLHTNVVGNAKAQKVFSPADAESLRGMTIHIVWTVTMDGASQPSYMSPCETVVLD